MSTSAINTEVVPLQPSLTFVGTPEMTLFKKMAPKRHTPFAKTEVRVRFNNTPAYGSTSAVSITNTVDLIGKMSIEWTVPEMLLSVATNQATNITFGSIVLADGFGHAAIDYVDVLIGSNRIDRHFGHWMQIWCDLTMSEGKRRRRAKLVGAYTNDDPSSGIFSPKGLSVGKLDENVPDATFPAYHNPRSSTTSEQGRISARRISVPLHFWFCQDTALAIPLVSLNTPVTVAVGFHPIGRLAYLVLESTGADLQSTDVVTVSFPGTAYSTSLSGNNAITGSPRYQTAPLAYMPIVDPVLSYTGYHLGHTERALYIASPSEYVINTLQYSQQLIITTQTALVNVNFEQHVKELIWMVTPIPYSKGVLASMLFGKKGIYVEAGKFVADPLKVRNSLIGKNNPKSQFVNGMVDPVVSCAIKFDGRDRVPASAASYFNLATVDSCHSGELPFGVYCYSFATQPEDQTQFTGQINASGTKLITFEMEMDPAIFSSLNVVDPSATGYFPTTDRAFYFYCFGVTLNTLRITAGQGGLATAI